MITGQTQSWQITSRNRIYVVMHCRSSWTFKSR
uniref:Uncharacterized protein n=1 Tax=Romanomermis culicivorax TaxID=13658 RepID=A0A915KSE3_ROMCU